MSMRSLLIASATALSLAAATSAAFACGLPPETLANDTTAVQVAQADPAPAPAAVSATDSAPAAPAAKADDPQN